MVAGSISPQVLGGGIRTHRNGFNERSGFYGQNRVFLTRRAATTSSDSSKSSSEQQQAKDVPDWAKPGSEVPPPWASGEKQAAASSQGFQDLPFGVYLLASALVAIAAVGSIFEYFNKNPVFGLIQPDSPFYTPLLGFFSITGIPVSAFLWFRAIKAANQDAERQDREDGYL